jgi:aryl-alcohol dehydrogenase-like predicted oxidoreductase
MQRCERISEAGSDSSRLWPGFLGSDGHLLFPAKESLMNKRRLGKTDIEISTIGLGCWQFSQGKGLTGSMWTVLDQPAIDSVVSTALKGGINWFDTAEVYGNGESERALGTALHDLKIRPDEVVIATKWFPLFRTATHIPRSIGKRSDCLQGFPIDLYQIHLPWSFSSIPAQMREMAGLLTAGKIRSVGVSNFSARQMEAASTALNAQGTVLASNQVSISLLDRRVERNGVLDAARRLGVTLIAYSPLAQGILAGRFHEDPALAGSLPAGRRSRLSPASRAYRPGNLARTAPLVEELRISGKSHGVSPAQVALAWLVTYYGDVVVAIPGASRPKQAGESAAAMSLRLTEKELARIEEASARVARF